MMLALGEEIEVFGVREGLLSGAPASPAQKRSAVCARPWLVCTRDNLRRISVSMGAWKVEPGPSRTGAAGTDHGAELPAASGPGSGQPGQHAAPPSDSSLPLGGTAELEPPTKRARLAEVAPSAPQSSAAAMLGAAMLRAARHDTAAAASRVAAVPQYSEQAVLGGATPALASERGPTTTAEQEAPSSTSGSALPPPTGGWLPPVVSSTPSPAAVRLETKLVAAFTHVPWIEGVLTQRIHSTAGCPYPGTMASIINFWFVGRSDANAAIDILDMVEASWLEGSTPSLGGRLDLLGTAALILIATCTPQEPGEPQMVTARPNATLGSKRFDAFVLCARLPARC